MEQKSITISELFNKKKSSESNVKATGFLQKEGKSVLHNTWQLYVEYFRSFTAFILFIDCSVLLFLLPLPYLDVFYHPFFFF